MKREDYSPTIRRAIDKLTRELFSHDDLRRGYFQKRPRGWGELFSDHLAVVEALNAAIKRLKRRKREAA